jgi:hypothetical protein
VNEKPGMCESVWSLSARLVPLTLAALLAWYLFVELCLRVF